MSPGSEHLDTAGASVHWNAWTRSSYTPWFGDQLPL